MTIAAIDFFQTTTFIVVTAKRLNNPVATNNFIGHLRDLANRVLNTTTVAAECDAQKAHDHRDNRKQNDDEYR